MKRYSSHLICSRVDDTRRARGTKVELGGARVKNVCGRRGGGGKRWE